MSRLLAAMGMVGGVLLLPLVAATPGWGQSTSTGTSSRALGDSFSERTSVGVGFGIGGGSNRGGRSAVVGLTPSGGFTPNGSLQFRQGGSTNSVPGFGGFSSSQGSLNFGVAGDGGAAAFGLSGGQSSGRSISSQAASVTVLDGHSGYVSDITQRPFVTGVTPVVGAWGRAIGQPDYVNTDPNPGPASNQSNLHKRLSRLKQRTSAFQGSSEAAWSDIGAWNAEGSDEAPLAWAERLAAARRSSAGQPAPSIAEIRRAQSP